MKLTLTHTTTEVISGMGFKLLVYTGEVEGRQAKVTIRAVEIPSSVELELSSGSGSRGGNDTIGRGPTPEQMAAVMSEMGRRSGLKPKAGRFGTLGESRQREVATAGGRASAAARIARKLTGAA